MFLKKIRPKASNEFRRPQGIMPALNSDSPARTTPQRQIVGYATKSILTCLCSERVEETPEVPL